MRISTIAVFSQSVSSMHSQQSKFIEVSQQLASQKRVVRPSDDPQAASRAVGVAQSKAVTEQFTEARVSSRNALSQEEGILNSVSTAITRAKTLLIQASSDTLSDVDRQSVASELKGVYETILGQANATDGNGRYLFGGYNDGSPPFVKNDDGHVEYLGDGYVRHERIDASRLMPVGDTGRQIFQTVHASAGYVAEAGMKNDGSLTFDGPRILDVNDPEYGKTFTLVFSNGGSEYSINGGPAEPYTSGETLTEGGVAITLDGEPADGDSLIFGPARAGYVAEADSANTGSLTFSNLNIVDATDPEYGSNFALVFSDDGSGGMEYSINGGPAESYTDGDTLTLGGVAITLNGTPDAGDILEFGPAEAPSSDLFKIFERAIAVLEEPASTDSMKATQGNTLRSAMRQLDNSLDNILTVRASVGARLNELDTVDTVAEKRITNYEQALSDLVDLDIIAAISEYAQRQIGLQAAQRSFMDISKLSLFNQM